jgi:hypothetical protein
MARLNQECQGLHRNIQHCFHPASSSAAEGDLESKASSTESEPTSVPECVVNAPLSDSEEAAEFLRVRLRNCACRRRPAPEEMVQDLDSGLWVRHHSKQRKRVESLVELSSPAVAVAADQTLPPPLQLVQDTAMQTAMSPPVWPATALQIICRSRTSVPTAAVC